jgi:anti-sigma factor RsiW
MTCRDSELLLQNEHDGALAPEQRARWEEHLAACPACRRRRAELAQAINALRAEISAVPLPDVDTEWRALRAKLHPTTGGGRAPAQKRRQLAPLIWLSTPLAAAAAVALALLVTRPAPQPQQTVAQSATRLAAPTTIAASEPAHAEFVEAGDANASTIVYVDKASGWLVVWATDTGGKDRG